MTPFRVSKSSTARVVCFICSDALGIPSSREVEGRGPHRAVRSRFVIGFEQESRVYSGLARLAYTYRPPLIRVRGWEAVRDN